jgi:hypothetical protein
VFTAVISVYEEEAASDPVLGSPGKSAAARLLFSFAGFTPAEMSGARELLPG